MSEPMDIETPDFDFKLFNFFYNTRQSAPYANLTVEDVKQLNGSFANDIIQINNDTHKSLYDWYKTQPRLFGSASENGYVAFGGDVVLKFEKQSTSNKPKDPLVYDAFYSYLLTKHLEDPDNTDFAKHFAKFKHLTRVMPPKQVKVYNKQTNKSETYLDMSNTLLTSRDEVFKSGELCLVCEKVAKTTGDLESVITSSSIDLALKAQQLIQLFTAIATMGQKYGFSHGDMHAGNILWNGEGQHFQLIDFGRTYIDDGEEIKADGESKTYSKLFEETYKHLNLDLENIQPSWFTRKPYKTDLQTDFGVDLIANLEKFNDPINKIMGAALDIGGLLYWMQNQNHENGNIQNVVTILMQNIALKRFVDLNTDIKQSTSFTELAHDDNALSVAANAYLAALQKLKADNLDNYFYAIGGIWMPLAYYSFIDYGKEPQQDSMEIYGGALKHRKRKYKSKCRRRVLHSIPTQHGGNPEGNEIWISVYTKKNNYQPKK